MNLQNRGTYRDKIMLYVPPNKKYIVKKAQEIAKREGQSLSQKFILFCVRFVAVHGKGNPQTLLDSFGIKQTKTCFFCESAAPQLFRVKFLSGLEALTCKDCLEDQEAKTTVIKNYGVC